MSRCARYEEGDGPSPYWILLGKDQRLLDQFQVEDDVFGTANVSAAPELTSSTGRVNCKFELILNAGGDINSPRRDSSGRSKLPKDRRDNFWMSSARIAENHSNLGMKFQTTNTRPRHSHGASINEETQIGHQMTDDSIPFVRIEAALTTIGIGVAVEDIR